MNIASLRRLALWLQEADLAELRLDTPSCYVRLVRAPKSAAPRPSKPTAAPDATAPKTLARATSCGHFHARHPARPDIQPATGDSVAAGDYVGLLAVGGLYLPVVAEVDGTLGAYLVADGQLVDYGTPLLASTTDY